MQLPGMQPPSLQRLLRVVLACWALLLVFEPPLAAISSGELRAPSAWLSPAQASSRLGAGSNSSSSTGVALAAAAPEVSAELEPPLIEPLSIEPLSILRRAVPAVGGTASHLDGRYLYLEFQSLLC